MVIWLYALRLQTRCHLIIGSNENLHSYQTVMAYCFGRMNKIKCRYKWWFIDDSKVFFSMLFFSFLFFLSFHSFFLFVCESRSFFAWMVLVSFFNNHIRLIVVFHLDESIIVCLYGTNNDNKHFILHIISWAARKLLALNGFVC